MKFIHLSKISRRLLRSIQLSSYTNQPKRCLSLSSSRKNTDSYFHTASDVPMIGVTIGRLLDRTVERQPDKEALVFAKDGVRRTFAQMKEEVDKLAVGLLSLGISRGDRVAVWAPNRLEWVLTQFATAKIGAVQVNINPAYRIDELEYALRKVGAKAIVTDQMFKTQNYFSMLKEICPELDNCKPGQLKSKKLPDLETIIVMDSGKFEGSYLFDEVMQAGGSEQYRQMEELTPHLQFDDPINIQFTSGTTGSPKGVVLSHHNIVNNCYFIGRNINYHCQDHRINNSVPLYHCFGMVVGSLATAVHGATLVYPSRSFNPEDSLRSIQNERCTSQYGTPTMFIDMLHHPDFDKYDMSSLDTGVMAGSPCPIEIMKQAISKMNMKNMTICYGLTETSPVVFQGRMDDPVEKKVGTVGVPLAHTEVKVIDPDTGEIQPVNKPGELCTRGYTTMMGYWEDEAKTKEVITVDGWFHTGDLATLDEKGYGKIVGRIKDLVIRGGENVYPTEIEQFLYKHHKIEDIQVVGVPDERLGEELCAWIKLKAGHSATEEEIKEFCKGQISHFKIPRYMHFTDSFPLTVTGKVQKFIMRRESIEILNLK